MEAISRFNSIIQFQDSIGSIFGAVKAKVDGILRTVGSKGETTERMLRDAGVRLIAKHGYEAVSLRMLAKEVGIQAGSLYNYISNKQEFLFSLLVSIIQDLQDETDARLEEIEDPLEAMRAFIEIHITFHTLRKQEVFIGNMELRSLTRKNYAVVREMRDRYEAILSRIIDDGIRQGQFSCSDAGIVKLAIVAMLTGVSTWYKPGGRHKISTLIDEYTLMVFDLLHVDQERIAALFPSLARNAMPMLKAVR